MQQIRHKQKIFFLCSLVMAIIGIICFLIGVLLGIRGESMTMFYIGGGIIILCNVPAFFSNNMLRKIENMQCGGSR